MKRKTRRKKRRIKAPLPRGRSNATMFQGRSPRARNNLFFSVLIIFIFCIIPWLCLASASEPRDPSAPPDKVPVKLYFNNGAMGDLVATPVNKETIEQTAMVGNHPPIPAAPVGRWSTQQLKSSISVQGAFGCTLWSTSEKGAKNAYFTVEVLRGTTALGIFNTSKFNLGQSPTRMDIAETLDAELVTGDTLSVTVYFYADPNPAIPFPQPAKGTFFFGGGQYTSRISITTQPLIVEVQKPEVNSAIDYIGFPAKVKEAFGADPSKMNYTMNITGPPGVKLEHLTPVETQTTEDGLQFVIDWAFTKDNAKDGEYTVSMQASYDGNNTVTNTSKFFLVIPKEAVTDLNNTPRGPLIIVGALAGVGGVVIAVYLNRKKIFKGKTAPKVKPVSKPKVKKAEAEDKD
jgi:hypothetical protein